MAARLINNSKMLVRYYPSLQSLSLRFQKFSSNNKSGPTIVVVEENTKEDSSTVWPDPNLGLLGPKDKRLPLPGNVGLSSKLLTTNSPSPKTSSEPDILTTQLNSERYFETIKQYVYSNPSDETSDDEASLLDRHPQEILECVAQECPYLLRKDFADLFLDVDFSSGPLTVITLTQKTKNDMSYWNEDVEFERDELLLYFVMTAESMCEKLQSSGYWADFIDPSCGRPYLGEYTNATLFETDERYRHLGFQIEDLGCCKVISHRLWGTYAFVGCVVTTAPLESEAIQQMLRNHTKPPNSKA